MAKPNNNNFTTMAKYSKDRILSKNKNSLYIFVGETGGGKTLSAASLLGAVNPNFYKSMVWVVFTLEEFITAIKLAKKGDCILFEEAGSAGNAREFMSKQNKMLGLINQTFRHKNLCVAYTVPSMRFVDLQVRDLMHTIVEMKKIDTENNLAFGDCWKIEHNALWGNTKLKKYEFPTFSGGRHVVDKIGFPKPPEEWIAKYEVKKTEFTTRIMDEYLNDDATEGKVDATQRKKINSQIKVMLNCVNELKKNHTWIDIQKIAGVSHRTIRTWIDDASENQAAEA